MILQYQLNPLKIEKKANEIRLVLVVIHISILYFDFEKLMDDDEKYLILENFAG